MYSCSVLQRPNCSLFQRPNMVQISPKHCRNLQMVSIQIYISSHVHDPQSFIISRISIGICPSWCSKFSGWRASSKYRIHSVQFQSQIIFTLSNHLFFTFANIPESSHFRQYTCTPTYCKRWIMWFDWFRNAWQETRDTVTDFRSVIYIWIYIWICCREQWPEALGILQIMNPKQTMKRKWGRHRLKGNIQTIPTIHFEGESSPNVMSPNRRTHQMRASPNSMRRWQWKWRRVCPLEWNVRDWPNHHWGWRLPLNRWRR